MSPITHFLVGWATANSCALSRRERATVAIAGVASDLDGTGFIVEYFTRDRDRPLLWYSEYHHVVGHNLAFAVIAGVAGFATAQLAGLPAAKHPRRFSWLDPFRRHSRR